MTGGILKNKKQLKSKGTVLTEFNRTCNHSETYLQDTKPEKQQFEKGDKQKQTLLTNVYLSKAGTNCRAVSIPKHLNKRDHLQECSLSYKRYIHLRK